MKSEQVLQPTGPTIVDSQSATRRKNKLNLTNFTIASNRLVAGLFDAHDERINAAPEK